ncbi:MAG: VOC family protein [Planctomycetes bacterium]|nr:VOC family protein [Planctomycetota bacterium]
MKQGHTNEWMDVCLRVADVIRSRNFYEGLGFTRVEGDDADGWAVVVNGNARIGLFEQKYMNGRSFMLNFRGGDVLAKVAALEAKGYQFVTPARRSADGGGSATLEDPDGHRIFFDAEPNETMRLPS